MHVNELYCILNEMKWKKRRSIYDTQFTDTQPPLHEYYYYYVENSYYYFIDRHHMDSMTITNYIVLTCRK